MKALLPTSLLAFAVAAAVSAAAATSPGNFQFDIPSGPLAPSIERFAATIGGDAIFDHTAPQGVQTQPVRGPMTPESALNQMLSGTGLYYRYNATSRRVVISRRR
jgi:hemoglobin/transferrin/lactoferrin receptor protein